MTGIAKTVIVEMNVRKLREKIESFYCFTLLQYEFEYDMISDAIG